MRLEELVRELRERRARLVAGRDQATDEVAVERRMEEEAVYDARLLDLARMLRVPLPESRPHDGGLYADHRAALEDRLAEAGVDLRP